MNSSEVRETSILNILYENNSVSEKNPIKSHLDFLKKYGNGEAKKYGT